MIFLATDFQIPTHGSIFRRRFHGKESSPLEAIRELDLILVSALSYGWFSGPCSNHLIGIEIGTGTKILFSCLFLVERWFGFYYLTSSLSSCLSAWPIDETRRESRQAVTKDLTSSLLPSGALRFLRWLDVMVLVYVWELLVYPLVSEIITSLVIFGHALS